MPFFECEFPRSIGFTSTGGPGFSTQVNSGFSGFEQRNRNWAFSKGIWQVMLTTPAKPVVPQAFVDMLYTFFLVLGGKADGFRLFWPIDFKGTAQACSPATGDGANKIFQLQKTYSVAGRSYVRTIKKPIMNTVQDYQGNFLANTVVIYDNGVAKTLGVDYTVDATTGLVTFTTAPLAGHAITADFQFHFPVRLDIDDTSNLQILESDVQGGNPVIQWTQINIVEIRI